jgi:hypothetical protein
MEGTAPSEVADGAYGSPTGNGQGPGVRSGSIVSQSQTRGSGLSVSLESTMQR